MGMAAKYATSELFQTFQKISFSSEISALCRLSSLVAPSFQQNLQIWSTFWALLHTLCLVLRKGDNFVTCDPEVSLSVL